MELKLSGLGTIRCKWGSIRIIVDDGCGEMAQRTRRVRFTHREHAPSHSWGRGKHKQRLEGGSLNHTPGRSISPTDAS